MPTKSGTKFSSKPEGLQTDELYINGISTSLPFDVQLKMIRTIPGLQNAEIMRPAYAIEYDYITSGQLIRLYETKTIEGLFISGQINGTTGYEEAAGQGLIAGINAALKFKETSLFLKRSDAYIGVMIDELITKELDEPYRMFTSRAEHRLLLRQDNADLRLMKYGYEMGMVSQERFDRLLLKEKTIAQQIELLTKKFISVEGKSDSLAQLLCRPETTYTGLLAEYPAVVQDHGKETNFQIEIHIKYAGYIDRQHQEVAKLEGVEKMEIPTNLDFLLIAGLSREAREKLSKIKPRNVGQAMRLGGITPADIQVLMVALRNKKLYSVEDEASDCPSC